MRSNPNTVAQHAGAYFCWEVPEEGVVVRFHLNLVDLLEQEAIVAGDRTAAGVLIGQTENGRQLTLTVESNDPVIPEPGASKTPFGNHRQIAEIVDRWRPGRKRISIVGFYRTSTREDELLDKEDLVALGTGLNAADIGSSEPENSNREHPKGLEKQTEHPPSQAVTADTMDASLDESTCSSQGAKFSRGSSSMQPERIFLLIGACPGRVSHATFYLVRSGTIVSHSPRVAFSRAELSKQKAPTEVKSPGFCTAPFEAGEDTEILSDEQKIRLQTGREHGTVLNWRWITASAVMAVVGIVVFHTGGQQRSDALAHRDKSRGSHLGLQLARSGTDWELSWDQDSPILLGAANGHLRITDGVLQKNLDLAPSELRTGRIMYTPATDDVVMQLEVESGKSEEPVSESVRILAGLSPIVSGSQARMTAPSQDIRNESRWPPVAAKPPALAARTSYQGSAISSAIAGPLPETFTKSQKPQRSTEPMNVTTGEALDEAPRLSAPPMSDVNLRLVESEQPSPPVPLTGGKVEPAQLISRTDPVYPRAAKLANISGTVETHFKISPNGEVRNVTATKGDAALTQSAIDAVRGWRYRPARLNGIPVEVQGTAVVAFKLN